MEIEAAMAACASEVTTAVDPAGQAPASIADRAFAPAETLRRIAPHLADLGITRVGLVTGLDRVGLPIGFAVRPNARALAVHQGKGLDDDAAMVSAAMEAVEVAVAERAGDAAVMLSLADAAAAGHPVIDLARLTRCRARDIDRLAPRPLLAGYDLIGERPVLVPAALVDIDHVGLLPDDPFDRSSDGLASGNRLIEAMLHGFAELIERDAAALVRIRPQAELLALKRAPGWFGSAIVDDTVARAEAGGLDVAFFDVTSDIDLPVMAALIAPKGAARRPDITAAAIAGGYAAHHDPAVAATKALLEAVQARATAISGARDDIGGGWYQLSEGAAALAGRLDLLAAPAVDAPQRVAVQAPPEERVRAIVSGLKAAGIRQAVVVPIGAPDGAGVAVCRCLVPGLEIGPGAAGRHIGARLLRAMLKAGAAQGSPPGEAAASTAPPAIPATPAPPRAPRPPERPHGHKVLFAGPSLGDLRQRLADLGPAIDLRPPVARGDVWRATQGGAAAIAIADGYFADSPPVWHKEILFALQAGVAVAGGASMGALRAAECAAFGMAPIGNVTSAILAGRYIDDGCVAQVHGPAELGYMPLSETLVVADATIDRIERLELITALEAEALRAAARAVFHADRKLAGLARAIADPARAAEIAALLKTHRHDVKTEDTAALLDWLIAAPAERHTLPVGWRFHATSQWEAFLAEMEAT